MEKVAPPPCVKLLLENDPELAEVFKNFMETATKPGALDAKTKLLIALGINVANCQSEGIKELTEILKGMGVKEEEIKEAKRMGILLGGLPSIVASYTK